MNSKTKKAYTFLLGSLLFLLFGGILLEYLTKLEQNPDKNFTTISILFACALIVFGIVGLFYSYQLFQKAKLAKKRKRTKVVFLDKKKKHSHT